MCLPQCVNTASLDIFHSAEINIKFLKGSIRKMSLRLVWDILCKLNIPRFRRDSRRIFMLPPSDCFMIRNAFYTLLGVIKRERWQFYVKRNGLSLWSFVVAFCFTMWNKHKSNDQLRDISELYLSNSLFFINENVFLSVLQVLIKKFKWRTYGKILEN